MKELFQHIEYLLRHNKCVTLPGFGAFMLNIKESVLHQKSHSIIPPHILISFNSAINYDDGILAKSYSRKFNISYEDAQKEVLKTINIFIETLNKRRFLKIGNIGFFKLGEENNIIFTPSLFYKNYFSTIGYHHLSLINTSDSILQEKEKPFANINTQKAEKDNNYYYIRIPKYLPNIAAAAITIVVLALTLVLNPMPENYGLQKASVLPVKNIIENINPSVDSIAETTVRSNNNPEENLEISILEDNISKKGYHLIVATFNGKKEAEKFIENNQNSNLPLQLIESKTLSRVSVASSDSKDELRELLNSPLIRQLYPTAWIWKN